MSVRPLYSFSVGIDSRRQYLTSIDVRFWRLELDIRWCNTEQLPRHLSLILTLICRLHYDLISVVAYYINHLAMTTGDMNTNTESNSFCESSTSFLFTELVITMKYGGGFLCNLVFTEWRQCVSQNSKCLNRNQPFQCGDRLKTSESDVLRRQILTSKDGPRTNNN